MKKAGPARIDFFAYYVAVP